MRNYPEPPELGWYAEDIAWAAKNGIALAVLTGSSPEAVAAESADSLLNMETDVPTSEVVAEAGIAEAADAQPASAEPAESEEDSTSDDDMDSTVLSVRNKPKQALMRLRNRSNGQEVTLFADSVLGRKLSKASYPDLEKVRLSDSTRTVSREHAIIRFDDAEAAWVEDLHSLNGTSILRNGEETAVEPGSTDKLTFGDALRVGDEFYDVLEPKAE